jgi:hypothetical protein
MRNLPVRAVIAVEIICRFRHLDQPVIRDQSRAMLSRVVIALSVWVVQAQALEPVLLSKGAPAFTADFSRLPKEGWKAYFGEWKTKDGVLHARQHAGKHIASAHQALEMQDGIFQVRFRLVGKGKGFDFTFRHKPGSLKKKDGRLISVMVTPARVWIRKHQDRGNSKQDPDEDLAKATHKFAPGQWHTLLFEKRGNDVVAQIRPDGSDQIIKLKASHPTFHVPTPNLVFRCTGDGIEIDDVKVWKSKKP